MEQFWGPRFTSQQDPVSGADDHGESTRLVDVSDDESKVPVLVRQRLRARATALCKQYTIWSNQPNPLPALDGSWTSVSKRDCEPGQNLCTVCSIVDLGTITGHHDHVREYDMGYVDDIMNNKQCALCRLLSSSFALNWTDIPVEDEHGNRTRCHLILPGPQDGMGRREISVELLVMGERSRNTMQRIGKRPTLKLLNLDVHKVVQDTARKVSTLAKHVNPSVDLGFCDAAYRNCLKMHRVYCSLLPKLHPIGFDQQDVLEIIHQGTATRVLRLIDVNRECIVAGGPDYTYIALSYVWGRREFLRLLSTNFANLHEEGAFRKYQLPDTITDAIQIVKALGERYLWVDALCIIQDSSDDKAIQIQYMDHVYSNASLTIVAGDGEDAYSGLSGVSRARKITEHIECINGIRFKAMPPRLEDVMDHMPWNTRGWTFQECALSPRLLVFAADEAYLLCRAGHQAEGEVSEQPQRQSSFRRSKIYPFDVEHHSTFWSQYCSTVADFSCRKFTMESDIQNALTGMLSRMSLFSDEAFICGLPETQLEVALLWESSGTSHRRMPTASGLPFPSWSWTGWVTPVLYNETVISNDIHSEIIDWKLETPDGKIHTLYVDPNFAPDQTPIPDPTLPSVRIDPNIALERPSDRNILVAYQGLRDGQLPLPDFSVTCPPWSASYWRKESPLVSKQHQNSIDRVAYAFAQREEDQHYLDPRIETGILCFTTQAAIFTLNPTIGLYQSYEGESRPTQTLCIFGNDEKGKSIWVGYVTVPQSFASSMETRLHFVEIIVLSRTRKCLNSARSRHLSRIPENGLIYDETRLEKLADAEISIVPRLYNIMWIASEPGENRRLGIAVRRGIGQIHMDGWRMAKTTVQAVRLG